MFKARCGLWCESILLGLVALLSNCKEEEGCEPFSVSIKSVFAGHCGGQQFDVTATANPNTFNYYFDLHDEVGNNIHYPYSSPLQSAWTWTLSPGKYKLRVVNADWCELIHEFNVDVENEVVAPLSFSEEITHPMFCIPFLGNGSIKIKIEGGQPPYSASAVWIQGSAQPISAVPISEDELLINNLYEGEYRLSANDNCNGFFKHVILENQSPISYELSLQKSYSHCPSGAIYITDITGGVPPYKIDVRTCAYDYSYGSCASTNLDDFGGSNQTFESLSARQYSIRINDSGGLDRCISMKVVTIESIATEPITLNFSTVENTDCLLGNGKIFVEAAGGVPPYQFQIANSSTITHPWSADLTYTGLSDITYNVSAKDDLGCITTKAVVIPQGNTNVSYVTDVQPLFTTHCNTTGCHDGTLGATTDFRDRLIIKSKGDQIINHIANKTMPPPSYPYSVPLSDDQIKLITCWIKDGSPDN